MIVARPLSKARVVVPDAVHGDVALGPRMRATTRALAEAFYATDEGPPPDERLDWLVDEVEDFFRRSGRRALFFFALLLLAIAIVAPLLIRKSPPFRRLERRDRARALEAMERSALGLAIFGVKAPLSIIYYEHPEAAAEVGYDGACLEEGA